MHPLDLTLPATAPIVINGTVTDVTVCQATYQYFDLDPTNFAGFDLVLGDAFLRSVYASYVSEPLFRHTANDLSHTSA